MFKTTPVETRLILSGKLDGVTRPYNAGGCPHKVGSGILITTPEGLPYAKGRIRSIREGTLSGRKVDERLAKMDGFTNTTSWYTHWAKNFGPAEQKVYRLQLSIEEVDLEGKGLTFDVPS